MSGCGWAGCLRCHNPAWVGGGWVAWPLGSRLPDLLMEPWEPVVNRLGLWFEAWVFLGANGFQSWDPSPSLFSHFLTFSLLFSLFPLPPLGSPTSPWG